MSIQSTGKSEHEKQTTGAPSDEDEPLYISTRQVRDRYGGVSEMWIERRLKDPASGFPKPSMVIANRRFWTVASLEAFERAEAANVAVKLAANRAKLAKVAAKAS